MRTFAPPSGWAIDPRAEARLVNGDRYADEQIVAFAAIHRMRATWHRDVEITRSPRAAGVAFAGHTHAFRVGDTGGSRTCTPLRASTVLPTHARTHAPLLPAAAASWTAARKHHVATDRPDRSAALTYKQAPVVTRVIPYPRTPGTSRARHRNRPRVPLKAFRMKRQRLVRSRRSAAALVRACCEHFGKQIAERGA
jgi:hypothetical protein